MGTETGKLVAKLMKDVLPASHREAAASSDAGRTILAFLDALSEARRPDHAEFPWTKGASSSARIV